MDLDRNKPHNSAQGGLVNESDCRETTDMDMEQSDLETEQPSSDKISDNHTNGKQSDVKSRPLSTKIVQVTNIAPSTNLEQLRTLFNFLGEILNIELYVSEENSEDNRKVCFVEFADPSSVLLAQHLTNTVFIDRALVVLPYNKQKIPDKESALDSLAGAQISEFNHGFSTQAVTGVNGIQMISTIDPRLTALNLPQYPQLPATTDPTRVEEIRRTVYIGNLDSSVSPDEVMKFFNDIGEVKFIRMAGDDTQPTRFAFVEFTHQSSIANALQHNGAILGNRALKINHSNNAIVKPVLKSDIDDSLRRVRDSSHDHLSRDRHHSPRDDRYHRDRHRNRDRFRTEYSRSHRSRSRDRERRHSRSKDHTSSRHDHSRDRGSRKRSRSRDLKRRRSRSSERSRSKHHHKSSRR